jgi:hypothetical protein
MAAPRQLRTAPAALRRALALAAAAPARRRARALPPPALRGRDQRRGRPPHHLVPLRGRGGARGPARGPAPVESVCHCPVLRHLGWDNERYCPNGLPETEAHHGRRAVHASLARKCAGSRRSSRRWWRAAGRSGRRRLTGRRRGRGRCAPARVSSCRAPFTAPRCRSDGGKRGRVGRARPAVRGAAALWGLRRLPPAAPHRRHHRRRRAHDPRV